MKRAGLFITRFVTAAMLIAVVITIANVVGPDRSTASIRQRPASQGEALAVLLGELQSRDHIVLIRGGALGPRFDLLRRDTRRVIASNCSWEELLESTSADSELRELLADFNSGAMLMQVTDDDFDARGF